MSRSIAALQLASLPILLGLALATALLAIAAILRQVLHLAAEPLNLRQGALQVIGLRVSLPQSLLRLTHLLLQPLQAGGHHFLALPGESAIPPADPLPAVADTESDRVLLQVSESFPQLGGRGALRARQLPGGVLHVALQLLVALRNLILVGHQILNALAGHSRPVLGLRTKRIVQFAHVILLAICQIIGGTDNVIQGLRGLLITQSTERVAGIGQTFRGPGGIAVVRPGVAGGIGGGCTPHVPGRLLQISDGLLQPGILARAALPLRNRIALAARLLARLALLTLTGPAGRD